MNREDGEFLFPAIEYLRFAALSQSATLFLRVSVLPMSSRNPGPAEARPTKLFIVARSKHIVPKERRIERLASGYSVREYCGDSGGEYWFVITSLELA
jgi:hypothetical protein